jgi:4-oxalmesaconate hydratase
MLHKPDLNEHLMHNVFFDTCVYHQPGINLLFDVINLDNILFGSEMVGAVRGIDPETGHYFDDTKRYVDALDLTSTPSEQVFAGNARRVYPRLDARLKALGRA